MTDALGIDQHVSPVIRVIRLEKTYRMGRTEVTALRGVDLEIAEGEFVAVMGPSGSGKSTFLNLLGCLDRPSSGAYYLDGRDVASCTDDELADIRGRKIGFVFQSFNLLSRTTATENVELPIFYRRGRDGGDGGRGERRGDDLLNGLNAGSRGAADTAGVVGKLLEVVGLPERGRHRPSELSGGEQQRVALARALVNSPSLILADEPTGNLDSLRSQEIMQTLAGLNAAGITIVLVTHEEDIAAYAKRLVRFKDGRIVSDGPVERRPPAGDIPLDLGFLRRNGHDPAFGGRQRVLPGFTAAEIVEHLRAASRSLWHNKLRSFLTALGILIGVAAVIAMVSVGEGARSQVQSRIEGLGTNLLTVMPGSSREGLGFGGAGTATTLTLDDAGAIRSQVANVVGVAPEMNARAQVKFGRNNWNTSITGTTPDYPTVRNWDLADGSFFTQDDVDSRRSVAVVGQDIVTDIFGGENPVGQILRIRNLPYRVVGVMAARGGGGFGSQDDIVLVPISNAMVKLLGPRAQLRTVSVSVTGKNVMDQVKEDVTTLLRARHKLAGSEPDDFQIISQQDILQTAEGVTGTLTLLLASIAGISLLVGGIGIMNIMLVSVTERTREIGLRKAIGARRKDIMLQFLTEAVILSVTGGAVGWVLGAVTSRVVSVVGKMATEVNGLTVVIALGFALAVGVFFGLYPARKASRLDPIQALRYE